MTPEERRSFEDELKADDNLRNELKELSYIYTGTFILDSINTGHIDSESLVDYAENPSSFDKDSYDEIKSHLETCKECREEFELCRQTYADSRVDPEKTGESLFERIGRTILAPRLVFRPVYGMLLLVLLSIPIYLSTSIFLAKRAETITCRIESGTRATGIENYIIVKSNTKTVRLEFMIPVRNDCIYDFMLYDPENRLKLTKHDNIPQKHFTFEVPTTYLIPGDNLLVVKELKNGVELENFELYFNVEFDY
jgi:hypothetical protein